MKRNFMLFPIAIAIILVSVGCQQNELKPKTSKEVLTTQILHDFGSNDAPVTSTTPEQSAPIQQPAPPKDTLAIETQLSVGDNGDDVKLVQIWLNKFGYKLTEDGAFGKGTEGIVKDFQKRTGISITGIVDQNTVGKLNTTTPADFGKDYYSSNSSKDAAKSTPIKSSKPKTVQASSPQPKTNPKVSSSISITSSKSNKSSTFAVATKPATSSSIATVSPAIKEDPIPQPSMSEVEESESYDSESEYDEEYNSDDNSDDEDSDDEDSHDHHYDHRRKHHHR